MESDLNPASTIVDAQSGVSWAAIAAGAVGAAALALILIAFGAGLGLSAVSPWSDSGVSAATFKTGSGIYLVIVAVMSSAVGGYLAGRLRTKWADIHTNEVFFRDTAHGFLAWAFATLLSATALSSAAAYLSNGTAAGLSSAVSQTSRSVNPADIYVDRLLWTSGPAQAAPMPPSPPDTGTTTVPMPATPTGPNPGQLRAEVLRLWTADFHDNQDLSALLIPILGLLYPMIHFLPRLYDWLVRRKVLRIYGELRLLEDEMTSVAGRDTREMVVRLNRLEEQANHIRMPLAYASMLYTLRDHIVLVSEGLKKHANKVIE